jgi:hypothetical protein
MHKRAKRDMQTKPFKRLQMGQRGGVATCEA